MLKRNNDQTQRSIRRRAGINLLLSLASVCLVASVGAQQNGTLPEGATVSALGRTAQVRSDGSFTISNVPANTGRFRVRLIHPNGTTAESNCLTPIERGTTLVPPLVFGSLTTVSATLAVQSSQNIFTAQGQTAQLQVTANLQGGGTSDITNSLCTTYLSSNASFVAVSAGGLVTVNNMPNVPATVIITVTNEGVVGTASLLLNPGPATTDLDGDGMPNDWELRNGFDPTFPGDAAQDADNDGLTNLQEFQQNLAPRDPDTDRDGISDGFRDPDGAGPIIAGPDPEPLLPETVPPNCVITSPTGGATVTEGEAITIRATATDNVGVSRVTFTSSVGGLNLTDSSSPYEVPFVVPIGVSSVTLSTASFDIAGNRGNSPPVSLNVISDPLTSVAGRVLDENQTPLSGASVSVLGHTGSTGPDGAFFIVNVPTVQGNLVVAATFTQQDGTVLAGSSAPTPPVRGGTTNVGNIVVTSCSFENDLGTNLGVCDDCSFGSFPLPFSFPYYGVSRPSMFINNNGNITFNAATSDFTENLGGFRSFGGGMIAAFWDDLDSRSAQADSGCYVNFNLPGKVVVTWWKQREFGGGGSNSLQMQLFPDGRIAFLWQGMTAGDSIVGISPGPDAQGIPPLRQVDFSATPSLSEPTRSAIGEQFLGFGSTPFDLDGGCIIFTPNGNGYDAHTVIPSAPTNHGSVSGTVFDAKGQLLRRAEIDIFSSHTPAFHATVKTDPQGHYYCANVPCGGMIIVKATQNGSVIGMGVGEIPESTGSVTIDVRPFPPTPPKE